MTCLQDASEPHELIASLTGDSPFRAAITAEALRRVALLVLSECNFAPHFPKSENAEEGEKASDNDAKITGFRNVTGVRCTLGDRRSCSANQGETVGSRTLVRETKRRIERERIGECACNRRVEQGCLGCIKYEEVIRVSVSGIGQQHQIVGSQRRRSEQRSPIIVELQSQIVDGNRGIVGILRLYGIKQDPDLARRGNPKRT